MMFDISQYYKAESVKEAVRLLAENPGSKLIAGGTDVLIRLREGHEGYSSLVDIHGLAELKGVSLTSDGDVRIGAGTTFSEIINDSVISKTIPVLALASGTVGGPQVRNVATIGGNLCNGAVSADSLATLCVLDALFEIDGVEGMRIVPVIDFYVGPGKVVLGPTEVLRAIHVKSENYENYGMNYYKYAMRNAMDIATIGCAAACKLDGDRIETLKAAFTVAGPKPARAKSAEEFAKGVTISAENIKAIAEKTLQDLNPRDSWRASKDFRIHIIKTIAERVIRQAVVDAGGVL